MERSFFTFSKQSSHNPWLDLLRSLAIFLVLLRHGTRTDSHGLTDGPAHDVFSNGWVGVDLFFVLSGYLISKSLIRNHDGQGFSISMAYFRDRFLRIAPAYYAVLILCSVPFFPGFQTGAANLGQSFLAHLLFLQDYSGADINVVFWSLGVEEKFYILAPILVALLLQAKTAPARGLILLGLLLISPLLRGLTFEGLGQPVSYPAFFTMLRSPFHMSMEGFVVGIGVALLEASGWTLSRRAALAGFWSSAAVLLAWLGSAEFLAQITRIDVWLQPTALALLFGVMLLSATALKPARLHFEPFFRVNARLSYALYLLHFPLIPLAIMLSRGQQGLLFWANYLMLAYLTALALHFGIEKPFLQLKQRLGTASRPAPGVAPIGVLPS